MMTLVVCHIQRPTGSLITFGGKDGIPVTEYHFKPNEAGHHVADVPHFEHRKSLTALSTYDRYDEYLEYLQEQKRGPVNAVDPDAPETPAQNGEEEPTLAGQTPAAAVAGAETAAQETIAAPKAETPVAEVVTEPPATSEAPIQPEPETDQGKDTVEAATANDAVAEDTSNEAGPSDGLDDLDPEALAEKFQEVMGRKPSPSAKPETIIARIREELESKAE